MTYKVKVKYVFYVTWEVEAKDRYEAQEIAEKHCGVVLKDGSIHTSATDTVVTDWSCNVHPEVKRVISVRKDE